MSSTTPTLDVRTVPAQERYSWDYLEAGPRIWRVSIAKLKSAHGDGQCCGSCGGA